MPNNQNPVERKTWDEFRNQGLLWWINSFLHIMGWSLVVEVDDETGKVTNCYPARTVYRGFTEADSAEGFQRVSKYLKENIDDLEMETYE